MKKMICTCLLLAMLCAFFVPAVNAAADYNEKFSDAVWLLDGFGFELNPVYMHYYVCRELYTNELGDANDYGSVAIPAADYEAVLYKYFVLTDAQLSQLRQYEAEYDEEAQTYTISYLMGSGGAPADFEYLGYVTSGDGYDIFSVGLEHKYLADEFASYQEMLDYVADLGDPDKVVYDGVEYVMGGFDEYICTTRLTTGRKYHVKLNGDVVQFVSCVTFTEADLPAKFEPITPVVTVKLPSDGSVSLPDAKEVFSDGTHITVSMVTDDQVMSVAQDALKEIATEFVVYDFSARKDQQQVQPDGELKVVFAIPEGFSNDISVYYMTDDGKLELLDSTLSKDGKSITVKLTHFSKYLLVDNSTKPAPVPSEPSEPSVPTEPSVPGTTAPAVNDGATGEMDTNPPIPKEKDNTLLWFIIAIAALGLVSVVVAVITLTRKKN